MKKIIFSKLASLLILLLLLGGCSNGSTESHDPDSDFDTETEQVISDTDLEDEDEKNEETEPELDDTEEEIVLEPIAEFLGGKVVSETEIVFEFSMPVTLQSLSLSFNPDIELEKIYEGNTITLYLGEDLEPGLRFIAEFEAEDEWDNLINTQVSLIAKNNRPPDLLINELRTEFSGSSQKEEFIEFKILSEGNLGGLQVFAASNKTNPMIYEFPPAEVMEGEYVVLYLRTLDKPNNTDSFPTRSFWIPDSSKLLRKTDAVYVMDQDSRVLAAIMIAETPAASWTITQLAEAAEFLFEQGAWTSEAGGISSPADAASSENIKTSLTRSISRDETMDDSRTAADWYVTANNGATPGLPNNPQRF